jgi:hypothetical protein
VLFILTAGFLLLLTLDHNHAGLVGDLCLIVVAALLLATAGTGWHLRCQGRSAVVRRFDSVRDQRSVSQSGAP